VLIDNKTIGLWTSASCGGRYIYIDAVSSVAIHITSVQYIYYIIYKYSTYVTHIYV
jgi:hypothetical protein